MSERREGHSRLRVRDGKLETFDPNPPEMVECESCIGIGKIREEGETPAQDTWRRCMDCTGTGKVLAKADALRQLLAAARNRKMSPKEVYDQRVSFIYGNLPEESTTTIEQIKQQLADQGIVDPAALAAAPLSKKERDRLDRLRDRCDALRERIKAGLNPNANHHTMELSALEWAIDKIEAQSPA